MSLENAKVGDYIATERSSVNVLINSRAPIDLDIYTVERLTATQVVAISGKGVKVRFRKKDGLMISGNCWGKAALATKEMIEEHNKQVKARNRYTAALKQFREIKKKPEGSLTVEQLESIVAAYAKATGE